MFYPLNYGRMIRALGQRVVSGRPGQFRDVDRRLVRALLCL